MEQRLKGEKLTMVCFNTGGANSLAVVVDDIIGMRRIDSDSIVKNEKHFEKRAENIGLLFPTLALVPCPRSKSEELIHIIDSTYLDKVDPITEDAGELELF